MPTKKSNKRVKIIVMKNIVIVTIKGHNKFF